MTARITRSGVLAMAVLLPLVAGAQLVPHQDHDAGAFVITSVNGDASCRQATPEEEVALRAPIGVATHVFGEGRARIKTNAEPAGLNIILQGTDQLEATPEAKAAFEKAAEIWESRISTPVEIIVKVDYGTKRFGVDYSSANILGSTTSAAWIYDEGAFPDLRAAIVDRADNSLETSLYNALPTGSVPTDLGANSRFGAASALLRALAALPPQAKDDPEIYQGSTSPAIGFNSAFSFDFDPSDGIAAGKTDFIGVAVHEMGHMLGFISRVGATETGGEAAPAVFDLFRFRPGVDMSTFTTADRVLSTGGEQVFFGGGKALAFSTGNPRGENGDAQQASHWKDDAQSGIHIGIMDPTLARARRVELTRYDLEAFAIMGWDITSPGCTELEPNEKTEDANALPYTTPCTGTTGLTEGTTFSVKLPNDVAVWVHDIFAVTLPSPAKLNVSLSFTTAGSDLNLLLLRADHSLITSSAATSGSTESFESSTLDAGTYYIGVSAAAGTSPYTLTVTPIGLKPPAPNAPSSLIAVPASSSSIRLNWIDNSTNEADFRVERNINGVWTEIAVAGANTTSYVVTGLTADSAYTFRVRARNEGGDSAYTTEASAQTLVAPGACVGSDTTVCLLDGRFRVTVDYLNQFANPPQPGKFRTAKLLPGTQNPDTATFGFSSAQAIEVVVRVQDTRPFGLSRFDVYYGGMTDVEYTVTVQDMQTGTTRLYRNPPGMTGGGVDRDSFPSNGAATDAYQLVQGNSSSRDAIVKPNVAPHACVATATTACLLSDRFEVKIDYLNQFANPPAPGSLLGAKLLAGVQNPDAATFGFSSPQAIEAVVRIQDARPFGLNRFDIYFGGMTDVEYTVTITDTTTGRVRQYRNPPGSVGGGVDRTSFALGN